MIWKRYGRHLGVEQLDLGRLVRVLARVEVEAPAEDERRQRLACDQIEEVRAAGDHSVCDHVIRRIALKQGQ
jgi:hypothetical protein